jgi:hypothetical protein
VITASTADTSWRGFHPALEDFEDAGPTVHSMEFLNLLSHNGWSGLLEQISGDEFHMQ